jgi:hypothetical protein
MTNQRKFIQVQEHFRWLVFSVSTLIFNENPLIGMSEFPV